MPGGRPPKLDMVVAKTDDGLPVTASEKVLEITRTLWAPWDIVAKAAGITRQTLVAWIREGGLARGRIARGERVTASQRRYAEFLDALEKAEGEAVTERLSLIRDAATGGRQRTKTVERVIWEGEGDNRTERVVERVTTTETAEPLWTAAAWLLERRRPAEFGRRVELTGADGTPLVPKEDRAAALAEALEAYQRGVEDGRKRAGEEPAELPTKKRTVIDV
jgi:hypothetical protein